MSSFYIILFLIGSVTLSKKIAELRRSIKTGNKEKMKADIFFSSECSSPTSLVEDSAQVTQLWYNI